jgi:hypothetical protein
MLQKLLELGEFDRDLNSLAIMPAGDAADAAALVRILAESASKPAIAALFDSDDGGQKRQRALHPLAEQHEIEIKLLTPAGTTTEDHLPAALTLYSEALATYLARMSPRRNNGDKQLSSAEFLAEIKLDLGNLESGPEGLTKGIATWSRDLGRTIGQLEYKPSPSGVAREYAVLVQDADEHSLRQGQSLKRARELSKWIAKALDLPALTLTGSAITEDEPADMGEVI